MDLLNCSTEERSREGAKMLLKVPGTDDVLTHQAKGDKEPREMYLVLLGPDSPKTQRELARIRYRMSKQEAKNDKSDDELERDRVSDSKFYAALTVGGLVFFDGKWVDVSDNAYDIYYKVAPIRGQALKFITAEANFIKG